jgi:vacuolar protein sorting-associated protein 26
MEVGIEDCLHIEFEYNKAAYHLKDTVLGKIYFLLVRIKLKYMEIELRRRETTGAGASARVDTETVAKFEIMDGAPARGEIIPIRMHLAPYELTPTYPNVHNRFGVKYMLNLVLVDDEDRRYFKQQEVRLYRLADGSAGEKEANDGGNGSSVGGNAAGDSLTPRTVGRALAGAVQRPASASPRAEGGDGKLEGERQ